MQSQIPADPLYVANIHVVDHETGIDRWKVGFAVVSLVLVAVGLMLAADYGPSWDESNTLTYGEQTLGAYLRLGPPPQAHSNLRYYGPIYLAVTEAFVGLVKLAATPWLPETARHFAYFLSLPISAICLYSVARRWVGGWAASAAALLMVTQPLLFGHAFINPKDMPFMAFFSLSIALGARIWDRLDRRGIWMVGDAGSTGTASKSGGFSVPALVRAKHGMRTAGVVVLVIGGIAVAFDLYFLHRVILPWGLSLVTAAYQHRAWQPINRAFELVAEHSARLPLEVYIKKATDLYSMTSRAAVLLALSPALVVLARLVRPKLARIRPAGLLGAAALAGVGLGLTTSIRVAGPLAGILVSVYALAKARRGAQIPLALYWAVAAVVCYATWPYLWTDPIARLWGSVQAMGEFEWPFPVLFQGRLQPGDNLPWYFVPKAFAIQLTLPALILGVVGIWAVGRQVVRNGANSGEKGVMLAWLIAPLLMAMSPASARYDNGRQYLFALPPLFLCVAVALEPMLSVTGSRGFRLLAATAILLPGVVGLVRLHPYEYIYYNELVGGVAGANRRYELDYWTTSYSQALEMVNATAPAGSTVFIYGPCENVWQFLRPDLRLYDVPEGEFDPEEIQYMVVTTRANLDYEYRSLGQVVETIEVHGAELTSIIRPGTDGGSN